ncbi:uncharacterized protein LOC106636445 [Copidosoma floridanum]|uniref:uncharacterized protein LOC106636445 n=1 Tax=Copidosoma floridanum TaxID=29053 RepID=UPI0006C99529|nr:uncharacterized protein LOC106636445 [Copidosoma floridanum]
MTLSLVKDSIPWPPNPNENMEVSDVTITNISDSTDSENFTSLNISQHDSLPTASEDSSSFSCIQLPVTSFTSDTLRIAPVTSCLMKNGYIRLFTAHHEIVTAKIKLIVALGISQKSHLELLILKEVIKFAKQ